MKNLDSIRENLKEISKNVIAAVRENDEEKVTTALQAYADLQNELSNSLELQELKQALDSNVLTARGIRTITSEERQYARAFIEAVKSTDPKQAITNLPKALPTTIINTVLEDIKTDRPLLNEIDIRPGGLNFKSIFSQSGVTAATWGAVTASIVTEIANDLKVIDGTQKKITAFLPIPKAIIHFAANEEWLTTFIISTLTESLGAGMEKAFLKGTGKDEPIGMNRNLDGAVTGGVYPVKTAVSLTEITAQSYGTLLSNLAKVGTNKYRAVNEVFFVCNPVDYLKKVNPATTVIAADGSYKNGVFPVPTKVYTSGELSEGEAIIGLGKRYIAVTSESPDGAIHYDDSCQFLEDNRVFTVKSYGDGRPKDNNAFVLVNIANLKPKSLVVTVSNPSSGTSGTSGTPNS